MVQKTRDTFPGSMTRAIIKDKQDNVLVDGILLHERDENGTKFWIVPFDSYSSVVLDQFYTDTKMGQFLIWDLTSVYKEEYPAVTSVKLYVKCSRLL